VHDTRIVQMYRSRYPGWKFVDEVAYPRELPKFLKAEFKVTAKTTKQDCAEVNAFNCLLVHAVEACNRKPLQSGEMTAVFIYGNILTVAIPLGRRVKTYQVCKFNHTGAFIADSFDTSSLKIGSKDELLATIRPVPVNNLPRGRVQEITGHLPRKRGSNGGKLTEETKNRQREGRLKANAVRRARLENTLGGIGVSA
jgi:hypothetical protein